MLSTFKKPLLRTFVAGSILELTSSIWVAPGSPCSNDCGNVLDLTTTADIVCADSSDVSAAGAVFQGCLDCELTSSYVSSNRSRVRQSTDQEWLLYNSRYAVLYCVFGLPGGLAMSNPCLTNAACGLLGAALDSGNLSSTLGAYDYCAAWDSYQVSPCNACLRAGSQFILANLLTLLNVGCLQQPSPGSTISVAGEPFSSAVVIETTPSPSLLAQYNTVPAFPLPASVGIAVVVFVVLLFLIGCCIIWIGKRRRKAFLRRLEQRRRHGSSSLKNATVNVDAHETPTSQKFLHAWDDSPLSAHTDSHQWSPFDSLVSADDLLAHATQHPWPIQTSFAYSHVTCSDAFFASTTLAPDSAQPIAVTMAGDHLLDFSCPRKGKARLEKEECYEMQDVGTDQLISARGLMPTQMALLDSYVPALHHGWPGRKGDPVITRAITEDDLARGLAI